MCFDAFFPERVDKFGETMCEINDLGLHLLNIFKEFVVVGMVANGKDFIDAELVLGSRVNSPP